MHKNCLSTARKGMLHICIRVGRRRRRRRCGIIVPSCRCRIPVGPTAGYGVGFALRVTCSECSICVQCLLFGAYVRLCSAFWPSASFDCFRSVIAIRTNMPRTNDLFQQNSLTPSPVPSWEWFRVFLASRHRSPVAEVVTPEDNNRRCGIPGNTPR